MHVNAHDCECMFQALRFELFRLSTPQICQSQGKKSTRSLKNSNSDKTGTTPAHCRKLQRSTWNLWSKLSSKRYPMWNCVLKPPWVGSYCHGTVEIQILQVGARMLDNLQWTFWTLLWIRVILVAIRLFSNSKGNIILHSTANLSPLASAIGSVLSSRREITSCISTSPGLMNSADLIFSVHPGPTLLSPMSKHLT